MTTLGRLLSDAEDDWERVVDRMLTPLLVVLLDRTVHEIECVNTARTLRVVWIDGPQASALEAAATSLLGARAVMERREGVVRLSYAKAGTIELVRRTSVMAWTLAAVVGAETGEDPLDLVARAHPDRAQSYPELPGAVLEKVTERIRSKHALAGNLAAARELRLWILHRGGPQRLLSGMSLPAT